MGRDYGMESRAGVGDLRRAAPAPAAHFVVSPVTIQVGRFWPWRLGRARLKVS
jgi:hypothetical protein